jgi:hypothetical protein
MRVSKVKLCGVLSGDIIGLSKLPVGQHSVNGTCGVRDGSQSRRRSIISKNSYQGLL